MSALIRCGPQWQAKVTKGKCSPYLDTVVTHVSISALFTNQQSTHNSIPPNVATQSFMPRIKTTLRALMLLTLSCFALLTFTPSLRIAALTRIGNMLIHADPLEPSQAIVIAVDGEAPEILEAADLVVAGMAHTVWVFASPPDAMGREFARRGIPYADRSTVMIQTLHALGVTDVRLLSPPVDGSNAEAQRLPLWCRDQQFERIIFISVPDHSRRFKRMLEKANQGEHKTDIRVRYSRYAPFQSTDWWKSRYGVRTAVVETQKLLLDVLSPP